MSNESNEADDEPGETTDAPPDAAEMNRAKRDADETDPHARRRRRMVQRQIAGRDIADERVLEAMRTVPRHRFVPERLRSRAYSDRPLPIGHDQTISQPYIVALMTSTLYLRPEHRVLEIGTGSGYQAAILGEMGADVYSIEIVCELARQARRRLQQQGYDHVRVICGDGYEGWPEHAPFDRIVVTAAPPEIPEALVEQLAPGGRMVLPVGDRVQQLKVVRKSEDGSIETTELMPVRFVPMVHGDD